jgi:uncharacterized protein (DUF1778 family)
MDKQVLQKAINTYGEDAQQDMVIEEALELALAILKHRRAVRFQPEKIQQCRENVIEESADTKIMLKQVNMMFDCEEEVQEQIDYKVNRLRERLEK